MDVTQRAIDAGWTLPDGWTVKAETMADYDATPNDYDCYTPKQVQAWRDDQWSFVCVIVFVEDDQGHEWGRSVIGSVEQGWFVCTDEDDNVTGETYIDALADKAGEYSVIREYDMIREALLDAVDALERFGTPVLAEPDGVTHVGL